MSDDLCNDWGCDLVCMGRLSGRKRKTGTMITILADDRRHNNSHRLIEKTTNGLFGLMKLTTNGSDANLYAVTSMTKGNNSGCLIGCGSYVSGDSGPLQSWSTSDFEIGSGPAGIIGPDDPKLSSFTLQHTIALPYSIEGVMEYDDLRLYEDDCMKHLHMLCNYNKVMKKPVTIILLELSLASNGATLSDRALSILAELAGIHGFGIVVDEIMTGGRTKRMLSTMDKPKNFQKSVDFITMGKWLKCGMVLSSKRQHTMQRELLERQLPRGASTGIDGNEAFSIFAEVVNNLENIDNRRRAVLNRCHVREKDAWGKGLHIFIPGKRDGILAGTRNRLLPLITNTPIQVTCPKKCVQWKNVCVNERTVNGCRNWIIQPQFGGVDNMGNIYKIIAYLVNQASAWKDTFFQTEFIIQVVLGDEGSHKKREVIAMLNLLAEAEVIEPACKTKKRLRGWILSEGIKIQSILDNA